ncbi:MAG: exodeoxyribonuclease V subunit beta [Pseudoxanthomonas suwonensis]|nr:exodeoxyribonuclease V subunit beta [Pseudoxanthomonas suwonensis]
MSRIAADTPAANDASLDDPAVHDPYLQLPLHGVHAIEASAGTGKTFTLATLVLRLVVERGLRIGQVLAVTFTEAATQELRARIRARLLLAAGLLDAPASDDADDSEVRLSRAVLDRHLARGEESAGALRLRLREAADGIDLAAVFTIHGFCLRVLREHALASGQGFDPPELLANARHLREEIAADLWRVHAVDEDSSADLLALWPAGPKDLARDLGDLLASTELLPAPADPAPGATPPDTAKAFATLRAVALLHGDEFREALLHACASKVLNGRSYTADWINALFDGLMRWSASDQVAAFAHGKLPMLCRDALREKTNTASVGKTPDSPLCDAIADCLAAVAAHAAWREAARVRLLHAVRKEGRRRMDQRKRQLRLQTYDDLITRVADALQGEDGEALAAALRDQYAVALVDEFQDTDPRQWQIFRRVFGSGSDPALFLIGDPKQAIYGFRGGDVETYLAARAVAEDAPALDRNFRSRPGVLRVIEALYRQAGVEHAFHEPRIRFTPVQPGGTRRDDDFLLGAADDHGAAVPPPLRPAPALTLWHAHDEAAASVEASRAAATDACVAAIHAVLGAARDSRACIKGAPVQPGDIAVLVRQHHEATRIRQALAAAGIPAVAAGKQSLFATDEAREAFTLLQALLHAHDDGRLRAALSTVLAGLDAVALHALDSDADALRRHQDALQDWRRRLALGGPLALFGDLCAEHAPRLLRLLDGERRLTNYLQLAEQLQEATLHTRGPSGLVDWLGSAIANADDSDEAQLLRLESDARRVQIVTLHKSKGLEYPLVFVPYAGIHGQQRRAGRHVTVGDADGRRLHWRLQVDASGWGEAVSRWQEAERSEDARLLYVGLTRARDALWLAGGALKGLAHTALGAMLAEPDALDTGHAGDIVHDHAMPARPPRLPPESTAAADAARTPTRVLHGDWWVHSFSQLTRRESWQERHAAATEDAGAASDEVPATTGSDDDSDRRFGGSDFGNALHDVLERADFAAWADWREGDPAPTGETAMLAEALAAHGYGDALREDGAALLTRLVGRTLTVPLPEGGRLHALPAHQRRAEIEFHFPLQPTAVPALLALLHDHGVVPERSGFGQRRRLEGLMTGKIDLTYRHAGKWYVLDYKSNRLPRYDGPALAVAMTHSEYDLQALIYTVALHRWLRFRLGERYDYARDFGGVRYLFARGLAPESDSGAGVFAQRFPRELVDALDALFGGDPEAADRAMTGAAP